jgi:hypothetical protein
MCVCEVTSTGALPLGRGIPGRSLGHGTGAAPHDFRVLPPHSSCGLPRKVWTQGDGTPFVLRLGGLFLAIWASISTEQWLSRQGMLSPQSV